MSPKFVLVTTCWNEISSVQKWKEDVLAQSRQPDVISIVDAGSSDGTLERLEQWVAEDPRVRLEVWKKCNVAQGRNRAIANSDADIVVSTDMGCRLGLTWFEKLCEPFEKDAEVKVVAGNYAADETTITTSVARAAYYLNRGYHPNLQPGFLPSSRSIAYRKTVWDELGGYPEDLTLAADDAVYALQIEKAKYKTAYAPEAICYWGRHSSLRGYWKEAYTYGVGNGEAGIFAPMFMNPEHPRYSKFLSHVDACYTTIKRCKRPLFNALLKFDPMRAILLLMVTYGITISGNRGYAVGVKRGLENCSRCRGRLK